jgi:hypothetical protein
MMVIFDRPVKLNNKEKGEDTRYREGVADEDLRLWDMG